MNLHGTRILLFNLFFPEQKLQRGSMSACKVYNYKEANRAIYKWIDDWNDF